jgi:integrase
MKGKTPLYRKENSPYWFARFKFQGKEYWLSTKETNRKDAQDKADELRDQVKCEGNADTIFDHLQAVLATLPDTERGEKQSHFASIMLGGSITALPLTEAWQFWKHSPLKKGNPSASTLSGYEAVWKRFSKWLAPAHKKVALIRQVNADIGKEYCHDLTEWKASPATYNAHLKFLRHLFAVMQKEKRVAINPFADIPLQDRNTEGRENFTESELSTVCQKATGSMRYMIGLGLYTGMRLADVVNLKWENVKDKHIDFMPAKTRRTKKKLQVPLHPVLQVLLAELRQQSKGEFLFPKEREIYKRDRSEITAWFQDFLSETCKITTTEAAGDHRRRVILRKGFHSLRHSFVSLCAANTVPQSAIMELVGHGSPAMTEHYTHTTLDQKSKAVAMLPDVAFANGGTAHEEA